MKTKTILSTYYNHESDDNRPYFDKEMTNIVKGLALIMMFIHHFFMFPEWWEEDISYPIIEKISLYLQRPTKLCVSIFCFLTGYFYYFTKEKTYQYSFKKISDLLISYWVIYIPFAIIAATITEYKYTPIMFLQELFALKRPTMKFCWYVNFYCLFMLILPLVVKTLKYNIHINLLIVLIFIPTLFNLINKFIGNRSEILYETIDSIRAWFPNVLIGYLFAKYVTFKQIESWYNNHIRGKTINVILPICAIIIIPLGRYIEPSMTIILHKLPLCKEEISFFIVFDIIYAPLFIYFVIVAARIINIGYLKQGLSIIGKNSVLMWFAHCLFFSNSKTIFQPLLYLPQNPILVLFWGIALCLVISYIGNKLITKINGKKNQLFFS